VTTNLEFARWNERFGDERMTAALLDRLSPLGARFSAARRFRGGIVVVLSGRLALSCPQKRGKLRIRGGKYLSLTSYPPWGTT